MMPADLSDAILIESEPHMQHDAQLEAKAKAFFHGTQVLREFANTHVIPVISAIISPSEFDSTLTGTYYRMHCWMLDVGKLDWPVHFQSVLGALRGAFESLFDLKLLIADPSLVDADPPYIRPTKPERRRLFITDAANIKRFDDDRLKHWGADKNGKPITPEHWSGIDLASRTARVYSGSAGIAGISPDGVLSAFAYGHGRLQEVFSEGTEILCKTMHLFKATAGLEQAFELAWHASGAFVPDQTNG